MTSESAAMPSPPKPEDSPFVPPMDPQSSVPPQMTAGAAPPTTSAGAAEATAATNTSDLDMSVDLLDEDALERDMDLRNQVSALQKRMDASEVLATKTRRNLSLVGRNFLGMSARILRTEREGIRG